MSQAPLLGLEDLRTEFATPRGVVRAVDGVDLSVDAGETRICRVRRYGDRIGGP